MSGGAVLIVDDDETQAESLAAALRGDGVNAVAAVGADAALALMRVTPVKVVVCDLGLRGKNGLELAREIDATHPGTKVVLTGGFPLSDGQVRRCGCAAIAGFLPKPCDRRALTTMLNRLERPATGPLVEVAALKS